MTQQQSAAPLLNLLSAKKIVAHNLLGLDPTYKNEIQDTIEIIPGNFELF